MSKIYSLVDKFLMSDFSEIIIQNLNKKTYENLIIFDIGCYRGNFSRNLKNKLNINNNNFYLFDANKNLDIPDFNYYNLAISNKKEIKSFYLNDFFPSSGSSLNTLVKDDKLWNFTRKLFTFDFKKKFSLHKVQSDTLDNICNSKDIKEIDILKIDVEGSELDILLGAERILNNVSIIQLEILDSKDNFDKKYSNICDLLKKKYDFKILLKKEILSLGFFSSLKAYDVIFTKIRIS